jgi:hypothetical protein
MIDVFILAYELIRLVSYETRPIGGLNPTAILLTCCR